MKRLIVCVLLLMCFMPVFGYSDSIMEKNQIDNNASRYVLPNGMVLILKEDHKNPVAAIQVWVKTGSVTEDRLAGSGVSHFVEHMLFKGTEKRKVGQVAREIQNLGGEINAHTSFETTVYTVNIDSKYFYDACGILADCLMNSTFDKNELEKERSVILKEINMNDDDPERKIYKTFFNTIYAVHPYKDPIIGYEDIFKKLTRDDIVGYYHQRYIPNNIVLVAVGDFNAKEAYERIKDVFKNFKRVPLKPIYVPAEPLQMGKRVRIEEADINKAYLLVGFHTTDVTDADACAIDVMSTILGEGMSSRLYKSLREKHALVNNIGSWSFTPRYPGILNITATLDPKNYSAAFDEIIRDVSAMTTEPVSNEELEKAKSLIVSEYLFAMETAAGRASDLGDSETSTANLNYSKEYIDKIRKVTKEDIMSAARKYLTEENMTVAALVPRGFSQSKETAAKEAGVNEIQKIELPNGLKILVKEDRTLPILSIRAVMRGGLLVEDEKNNGISSLASQLLLKGTKTRTADEIAGQIEAAGGTIASYSANNSFGCAIDILSEKSDVALDIMADVLINPAFNEKDMEKEKKVILLNIKSLEDQPFQAASKLFRETMFKGHPYRFLPIGTAQSVEKITRADLADFHKKYVVPDNMVISVFGNVDAAGIRKAVLDKFGALKKSGVKFARTNTDFKKGVLKEKKKSKGKQAIVLLGYRSVDIFSPDKYPFDVLDAVFSGQGSRLFSSIRDEAGLAYALGSYIITGIDPGAFVFYAGTVPEKVDRVVELMKKEIAVLKEKGIGADELSRTQNGMIGVRKLQLQANSQLALQTALDELYGLGYDDYKKFYKNVSDVSKDNIKGIAKKYFTDDDYVIVVVSPE